MSLKEKSSISVGSFSAWLVQIRQSQISHEGMNLTCGDCRACCTSSYFIHIKPDEKETLSKIPKELLFKAPGLPKGNVLLGYDKNGHCPMFVDNKCSIYEYRPQTCRDYDCRIFAATGISEDDDKPLIVAQSKRWQFDLSTEQDYKYITALKNAAKFIRDYTEFFPTGFVPSNPTQQAIIAIKVYKVFLKLSIETVKNNHEEQINQIVNAVIDEYNKFQF